MAKSRAILGIDIGGSGIKGAPVDLHTGAFTHDRIRVQTPQPANVKRVAKVVGEVAAQFESGPRQPVGITFPGVVVNGVTKTAANVHKSWLDAPAVEVFQEAIGRPVVVVNDADAAGIAEMTFGVGKDKPGVTIVLTFGTGIGSAIFMDGELMPNTELGHLELRGDDAEHFASDHARETDRLNWRKWAKRVQEYLSEVERVLRPDLIVLGGGVSKQADKFLPLIDLRTPIVPAELKNDAGIVGAAMATRRR